MKSGLNALRDVEYESVGFCQIADLSEGTFWQFL